MPDSVFWVQFGFAVVVKLVLFLGYRFSLLRRWLRILGFDVFRLDMTDVLTTVMSKDFNNKAKKLAWREWLMLQKMRCMIFAVFVIVIIIIVIAICADGKTCAGPSEPAASSEGTVTAAGAVSTPSGSRRLLY